MGILQQVPWAHEATSGIPVAVILPNPPYFVKERFFKRFQRCRQALVRIRYLIIINIWNGRSARDIERVLKVHNTTVYRVLKRFREHGEVSLWDGREDNGAEKLSRAFLAHCGLCGAYRIPKNMVGVGRPGHAKPW